MDKMEFTAGNTQEPRKRKAKPRRFKRLGLLVLAVLLIVVGAALWDGTVFDGLRRAFVYATADKDENGCAKLYTYAAEKDGAYASLGGSLIQATPRRILMLGEKGETRYTADVRFTNAAVAVGGDSVVVYDLGGTDIYVLSEQGLRYQLTAEGEILAVGMNGRGDLAVTVNKSGYKAAVTIYNHKGEKLFGYHSSDNFLMTAAPSENGRQMGAVSMGQHEGKFTSSAVLYDLGSTEPVAITDLTDSAVYELGMVGERWCAVGENSLYFLSQRGEQTGAYDYVGQYLRRCTLEGDGFATLLLGRYKSGSQMTLLTVNSAGEVIASLEVDREVLSLSAAGRYIAVLYSDELVIYDRRLQVCDSLEAVSAAKLVLMRTDGTAVLVGSDAASLYIP